MTPTLLGRLHTRMVLLGTVGVCWTLAVVPFLPGLTGTSYGTRVWAGTIAVSLTAAFGLMWEVGYHMVQQLRWEKDWPVLAALAVGVPEGLVVRAAMSALATRSDAVPAVPLTSFWLLFASTWLVVWLAANGPIRVVTPRWRHRGGELWAR